jgi:hypothetical protein
VDHVAAGAANVPSASPERGRHLDDGQRARWRQFIEHAPGPRGSPQRPQGEGAASPPARPTATREKSTRSVAVAAHFGHAGDASGDESSSNGCEQALQTYS